MLERIVANQAGASWCSRMRSVEKGNADGQESSASRALDSSTSVGCSRVLPPRWTSPRSSS
jgi:hypothetical protein